MEYTEQKKLDLINGVVEITQDEYNLLEREKTYFQKKLEEDKLDKIKGVDSKISEFKSNLFNYISDTDVFGIISNRDEQKQLQKQRTEINEYIKNEISKIEIVYNDKFNFKIK